MIFPFPFGSRGFNFSRTLATTGFNWGNSTLCKFLYEEKLLALLLFRSFWSSIRFPRDTLLIANDLDYDAILFFKSSLHPISAPNTPLNLSNKFRV